MIELAQHIEALLLENDCVIVPGFGGFVAHYTSATQVKEDDTFFPPIRTIGFNPQLKLNDGMIVQSYMTAYDTNFSDATRIVEKEVAKLYFLLHEEGKVEFENIGEIRYTVYDTYEFVPYDHKITTPYLYGLDSFEIKELSTLSRSLKKTVELSIETKTKKAYEIRINRSFLHNAVAVIVAVILFFTFSIPIENTDIKKNNYAQLLPIELFAQIAEQSVTTTPIIVEKPIKNTTEKLLKRKPSEKPKCSQSITVKEVKVTHLAPKEATEQVEETKVKIEVNSPTNSPNTMEQKNDDGKFHIIIAGGISTKVAEALVIELKSKGFSGAKVLNNEGKIRVSISSYDTRNAATQQMLKLRENENYKNAWLLVQ